MYFKQNTPLNDIKKWAETQIINVLPIAKHGIEVKITPFKPIRTTLQNNFLMVLMTHIVKFYIDTGFMPDGCQKWMMRTDVQKAYWKHRYGIEHTSKLDTSEFTKFVDYIQTTMVEETGGNWEILTTDSQYLKSLLGE